MTNKDAIRNLSALGLYELFQILENENKAAPYCTGLCVGDDDLAGDERCLGCFTHWLACDFESDSLGLKHQMEEAATREDVE